MVAGDAMAMVTENRKANSQRMNAPGAPIESDPHQCRGERGSAIESTKPDLCRWNGVMRRRTSSGQALPRVGRF